MKHFFIFSYFDLKKISLFHSVTQFNYNKYHLPFVNAPLKFMMKVAHIIFLPSSSSFEAHRATTKNIYGNSVNFPTFSSRRIFISRLCLNSLMNSFPFTDPYHCWSWLRFRHCDIAFHKRFAAQIMEFEY